MINSNMKKMFTAICQENGMSIDSEAGCMFGTLNGYQVIVQPTGQSYQVRILVNVARSGQMPDKDAMKAICKSQPMLRSCTVRRFQVCFLPKDSTSIKKNQGYLKEALSAVVSELSRNGYENVCMNCGQPKDTDAYVIGGVPTQLCPDCYGSVSVRESMAAQKEEDKHENLLMGIVGALLGSLIGVIVIVIIGQLGYVSIVSGLVMGVCTMKGYQLLAGKMSIKGMIIGGIIMLLMTYVGHNVDWAISVAQYFEVDVFSAFRAIPDLVKEEVIDKSTYFGNMGLLYLFTLLGAVPAALGLFANSKMKHVTTQMMAR